MSSIILLFQFSVILSFLAFAIGQSANAKRRFEYKYSFKGPHLVQRDKSVPFWEYFDDTLAGDEGIRITPSLRSKKGSVWTKNKFDAKGWELEVAVRVTGRGRIGADGMAIWFTEQRSHSEDPNQNVVFGAMDKWNGLGVFLDSFDNDGKGNNPYISAVRNDGTVSYDHQKMEEAMRKGSQTVDHLVLRLKGGYETIHECGELFKADGQGQFLGGCMRDFRNKPFPFRVRIEYYNQALTIRVHNGINNNPNDFELCMTVLNVVLPQSGYFGVSAATGGLADDHDVLYVLTHSLLDPTQETQQVSEADRLKFEQEFEQYQKELDQARQQYKKEHPNQKDENYEEEDNWFQDQNEKELSQIFEGQNNIHTVLKDLTRRLDELMGRQEMVLSRVNQMSLGQQQGGQQPNTQQQGIQPSMPLQRHEVERLLNNQNGMMQQVSDMRFVINDIQAKANQIQAKGIPPANQGGAAGGGHQQMQDQMLLHELRDRLNNVGNSVQTLVNRPQANIQCPSTTGCVSTTFFVIAVIVQFALTIGYMVYRSNKEQQAKKFY